MTEPANAGEIGLRSGAVALIDALGFRGIWSRHTPQDVLTSLKNMKAAIEDRIVKQFATQPAFNCEVAFLSDTIAVSLTLDEVVRNRDAMSVLYLGDIISWILEHSLRSNVPLAYRGAIAIGSYQVSPHFLIGEAIDEAAGAHELAQGAFIWLTPAARARVSQVLAERPHNTHMVKFPVPLRDGNTFETFTVSPLEQARGLEDAHLLTKTLLGTFSGSRVDVAVKRQNTLRHIQACYAWRGFEFPQALLVS